MSLLHLDNVTQGFCFHQQSFHQEAFYLVPCVWVVQVRSQAQQCVRATVKKKVIS